jgi:hypothetical protein
VLKFAETSGGLDTKNNQYFNEEEVESKDWQRSEEDLTFKSPSSF